MPKEKSNLIFLKVISLLLAVMVWFYVKGQIIRFSY
jgi:YbbR domain-containing protein